MIHIKITSDQLSKIKKIWSLWFFKKHRINDFINVLDGDNIFRKFFFLDEDNYSNWKNSYYSNPQIITTFTWQSPIINYFFTDLSNACTVLVRYKKALQDATKEFLVRNYNNYRLSAALSQIIDILSVRVCPYCNRNFIDSYAATNTNGAKRIYFKGDLDHHYPKNELPALILSFYNLIPCCKVCNHEKLESTARPFYPYYDHEDVEYHFSIELYSELDTSDIIYDHPIGDIERKRFDSTVWQGISDNFKIILKGPNESDLNECMKNSNTIFKL